MHTQELPMLATALLVGAVSFANQEKGPVVDGRYIPSTEEMGLYRRIRRISPFVCAGSGVAIALHPSLLSYWPTKLTKPFQIPQSYKFPLFSSSAR